MGRQLVPPEEATRDALVSLEQQIGLHLQDVSIRIRRIADRLEAR